MLLQVAIIFSGVLGVLTLLGIASLPNQTFHWRKNELIHHKSPPGDHPGPGRSRFLWLAHLAQLDQGRGSHPDPGKGVLIALVLAGKMQGQVALGQSLALTVIVADTVVAVIGLALAVQCAAIAERWTSRLYQPYGDNPDVRDWIDLTGNCSALGGRLLVWLIEIAILGYRTRWRSLFQLWLVWHPFS